LLLRSPLGALIVILASATCVNAGIVLDQEHSFSGGLANSTNGDGPEFGQTFTVGVAGTLDHIDVLMYQLGGTSDPTDQVQLSVYNTAAGLPSGTPLVTSYVPYSSVPVGTADFVSFDVSAAELFVIPGEVLSFGANGRTGVQKVIILLSDGDASASTRMDYPGGIAVSRRVPSAWQPLQPDQDFGFRTFVNAVPEPSSIVMALSGLLACGLAAWGHRAKAASSAASSPPAVHASAKSRPTWASTTPPTSPAAGRVKRQSPATA
jgi:PEP-CTERM motif